MRVAIFGASGATGSLLTRRCVKGGHHVTVLVRSREFPYFAGHVCVVHGSVFDPLAVADTVRAADVVFSTLGARSLRREDVLERAVPLIVQAMQETATTHKPVRRIIVLGSAGALPDSLDFQPAWRRWIVQKIIYKTVLKWPVASQVFQYKALSTSGLDWTMVMPPMLTNGPLRGRCCVDGDALPLNATHISRADVAAFMFQQINSPQWIRKGVYISY
ncbi:NAD(P)-dependent oxidoreductase [Edaphobacter bradus]|uniref:NAD(P)-dependent oxidoreductase n=1 Tax=Edaphobacter bradus TaxID=2259016 RepID=UPI0021E07C0C|nr:NAD(P)H-binding protein [Edaphobacter bradus]